MIMVGGSPRGLRCRGVDPHFQRQESFKRLLDYLQHEVLKYSPWYRRVFAERELRIEAIESEEAFAEQVPFTVKEHLQGHAADFVLQPGWPGRPWNAPTEILDERQLARYRKRVEREEESSGDVEPPVDVESKLYRQYLLDWQPILSTTTGGSTGVSVRVSYTHSDIVGPFYRAGLFHHGIRSWSPAQRFMSLLPAGEHLGFYANFLLPLLHGQPVQPTFGGRITSSESQIGLARERGIQVIQSTTSYLAHWLEVACREVAAGRLDGLPDLEVLVVVGEALTDGYARSIKESLRILGAPRARLLQGMSSTELKSGGFRECDEGTGLHIDPQHFYVELVDPDTKRPVPEGRPGVLVWSHIGWHGTAIVRYWSGDVVEGGMTLGECPSCHLVVPRLFFPIRRLAADFVKIRGARVDLSELRTALESVLGRDGFQVVVRRDEAEPGRQALVVFADRGAQASEGAIKHVVRSAVDLRVDHVEFCPREQLDGRLYASGWKPRWLVNEWADDGSAGGASGAERTEGGRTKSAG